MSVAVAISPIWNGTQFLDNNGNLLSGGQIFQYAAGSSSTLQTTYSDSAGTIPNSNPIVLDSSGRIPVEIYLVDGSAYHLVLTLSDGTTVLMNVDNVIGVQAAGSSGNTTAAWTEYGTATYVSSTQFSVSGNAVADFAVGNRVQIKYGSGSFTYGTVSAVAYSSPNTQVTLVNDSTALSNSMTLAYYSIAPVSGPIVDAGAVTYEVPSSYTSTFTVGYQIATINTTVSSNNSAINTRVNDVYTTLTASGSGSNTPYTITADSNISSYTVGNNFTVLFTNASSGSPTLNVNSIGAKPLVQVTYAGATEPAVVTAGLVSNVGYDGTNFWLLDQLPPSAAAVPHGNYSTNTTGSGSWTAPSNVDSVEVFCVGSGGGGGTGYFDGTTNWLGGMGGDGGVAIGIFTVTPGTAYTFNIGAGGSAGGVGNSTTWNSSALVATGGQAGNAATGPVDGTDGANGYGSTSQYSYGTGTFSVANSSTVQGQGGLGGVGSVAGDVGTDGMILIKW